MSHLYTDLLGKERQKIFKLLKHFSKDFVLAGGTAMMLQLNHRISYDFDCFTNKEISSYLLPKIKKIFSVNINIELKTSEMILIKTKEKVDVSFVWHPYPFLQHPVRTESLSIFHLDDLIANKAYTVGRHNTWRDYVDIFYVLNAKIYSLSDIISLAKKKFEGEFNEKLFLGQLTYFKDIRILPIDFVHKSHTPKEIQSFLEMKVEEYIKSLKL